MLFHKVVLYIPQVGLKGIVKTISEVEKTLFSDYLVIISFSTTCMCTSLCFCCKNTNFMVVKRRTFTKLCIVILIEFRNLIIYIFPKKSTKKGTWLRFRSLRTPKQCLCRFCQVIR